MNNDFHHHKTTLHHDGGELQWSYTVGVNVLSHMTHGNRGRLGYNIAAWNCGRGLLTASPEESIKFVEIKEFIQNNNPHLLAIIESDLHGPNTSANRVTTFSTEEIKEKLNIDGYSIELPESWSKYHQARILVYVSDKI